MRVNKERIFKDVEYLTTLNPPRNYKNLNSIEKAVTYIENEFKRIDLKVENQYFIAEKNTYRNVIASYNINKKKGLS